MRKNEAIRNQTFGVGYATVIMIFVIICLSIMALLSYNAAGMNELLAKNNSSYITSYYSAEKRVTERIAELDGLMCEALGSPFFEEDIEASIGELEGVDMMKIMDGYSVSFSEKINDKLSLYAAMELYSDPAAHGGKRYVIKQYKTVGGDEDEGPTLSLWDGSAPRFAE